MSPFPSPGMAVPKLEALDTAIDAALKPASDVFDIVGDHIDGGIEAVKDMIYGVARSGQEQIDKISKATARKISKVQRLVDVNALNQLDSLAATQANTTSGRVTFPTITINGREFVPQIQLPGPGDGGGKPCNCALPVGYPPPECIGEYGFIVKCDPQTGIPYACEPWNDPLPPDDLPGFMCYYPNGRPCDVGLCPDPITKVCLPCPPPPPPPPPPGPQCCPVPEPCPPPVTNVYCESKCVMPDTLNVHIIPDCTPFTTFGCCHDTIIEDCIAREILPPIECPPDKPVSICVWPQNCDKVQFTCNVPLALDPMGGVPSMDSDCGEMLYQRVASQWNPWTMYAVHGTPAGLVAHAGKLGPVMPDRIDRGITADELFYLFNQ